MILNISVFDFLLSLFFFLLFFVMFIFIDVFGDFV